MESYMYVCMYISSDKIYTGSVMKIFKHTGKIEEKQNTIHNIRDKKL